MTGSGSINVEPRGWHLLMRNRRHSDGRADSGDWSFTGFSGGLYRNDNPQTLILNANTTVSAAFTQVNFPVNVTVVGPGT